MLRSLGWRRWLALMLVFGALAHFAHAATPDDLYTPAGGCVSCHQSHSVNLRMVDSGLGMLAIVVGAILFM